MDIFIGSSFSLAYVSFLLRIPNSHISYSITIILKICYCEFYEFVLIFHNFRVSALAVLVLLSFHGIFRISLSIYNKNIGDILIEITFDLEIRLGEMTYQQN